LIKWLLRLLLSLALIAALLLKTNVETLAQHLVSVSPLMLTFSIVLILLAIAIRAYRWSEMMLAYNVKLSFRKSIELIQMGNFFGQFLPMTVGGDMVRTWQAHRDGLPLKASIHTVLLDRWFGFVSLLVILLLGVPALQQFSIEPMVLRMLILFSSLVLAGLLVALVLDRLVCHWQHIKVFAEVSAFSESARHFVANISLSLPVFIASIATHLLSIAAVKMLGDGVGANVSFYQMLTLIPPVMLLTMLPFSMAGWGVREGSMIFALAYAGVPQEQAFAISILLGLVSLFVSLPGGLVMLYAPAKLGKMQKQ
jgi:hypothetical protein